jgi:phosphoglycolate phosphatase-like HAD superfamily hydrolase
VTGGLLLLFDIDGTLLHRGAAVHARALIEALRESYTVELPDDAVTRVGPWGKTDGQIAREVLHAAGLDDAAVDAGAVGWPQRATELYAAAELSDLRDAMAPGAREALDWAVGAGHTLGLVTGNLEPIARRKLAAAGLGERFEGCPGGFGSDAEARAELVPIARRRAGDWPRERALVIGDAPGDVACARADGVRCIAVAGHFGASDLAGAAAVIPGLTALPAAIEALQG